jgi:hypothetical protein
MVAALARVSKSFFTLSEFFCGTHERFSDAAHADSRSSLVELRRPSLAGARWLGGSLISGSRCCLKSKQAGAVTRAVSRTALLIESIDAWPREHRNADALQKSLFFVGFLRSDGQRNR